MDFKPSRPFSGRKISFEVRRVDGVTEGAAPELGMVVHARSIAQLRSNIASALKICFRQERGFEMLVGRVGNEQKGKDSAAIRPGEQFVMIMEAPTRYAGALGERAAVVSVSDHVCVRFVRGLLETYPLRVFSTLFVRVPAATHKSVELTLHDPLAS